MTAYLRFAGQAYALNMIIRFLRGMYLAVNIKTSVDDIAGETGI